MLQNVFTRRNVLLLCLCLSSNVLLSQDQDKDLQALYEELDSLFDDEFIPGNLFALADSLLALENTKISALDLRVGYVSQVVSAGRSFGIDQYGFTSGLTYFHHTGLFAGVSGYWSNEYSPNYYLSNVTFGYSYEHKKKLTLIANHDFYIYNDTLDHHSFNKSIQAAVNYNVRHLDAGVDYAYLYGNSTAHRITTHANGRFKLKLSGVIEAITFTPGVSFQWGNANVFYWRQPRTSLTDLYQIIKTNDYPRLGRGDYLKLTYLLENNRELASTLFLKERDYNQQQINTLYDLYYGGSVAVEDTFGFLNYSFSFPLIVRAKRFSLLVNYTYNIPRALPGETFTYDASSFFSSSLSYLIYWKK